MKNMKSILASLFVISSFAMASAQAGESASFTAIGAVAVKGEAYIQLAGSYSVLAIGNCYGLHGKGLSVRLDAQEDSKHAGYSTYGRGQDILLNKSMASAEACDSLISTLASLPVGTPTTITVSESAIVVGNNKFDLK